MIRLLFGICLVGAVVADLEQIVQCGGDILFVGDREDLCRYYWCHDDGTVSQQRCAHGTRVPTWYSTTNKDGDNPCSVFQNNNPKCLRCEVTDTDPGPIVFPDHCLGVECSTGCTCENLIDMYFCSCDGVTGGGGEYVERPDHCSPNRCINGATCRSEWDDYWCFCPPGYTGKNCEISICQPNPCEHGGTCRVDATNYHCDCVAPWRGPCCNETGPTPTENPVITTTPLKPDSDEYTYTLTFGDASQCGGKKFIYVSPGGLFEGLNAEGIPSDNNTHRVRIYTPDLSEQHSCYIDEDFTITPLNPLRYEISDNRCSSITGNEQVTSGAAVRVVEKDGRPLTVTAAPCDHDGWLAIRDKDAGRHYMAAPLNYGNFINILSLKSDNVIDVYIPSQNKVLNFTLQEMETVRIEYPDLSKAVVKGIETFNCWSGDTISSVTDSIEYENVEQQFPVYRWGLRNQTEHTYYITSPTTSINRVGYNFVSVESEVVTNYTFSRWNSTLESWQEVSSGVLDAESFQLLTTESEDQRWLLVTEDPVQVTHEVTDIFLTPGTYILSSLASISSVDLYRKSYSMTLHGAAKDEYAYHIVVLHGEIETLNSLQIFNVDNSEEFKYDVSSLGEPVIQFRSGYGYAAVFLNGPGFWYFYGGNNVFGATYYAIAATDNPAITRGGNLAIPLGFREFYAETAIPCGKCEIRVNGQCVFNKGSCDCYECDNVDDICTPQKYPPQERTCTTVRDGSGHTVSLLFMHNSEQGNLKREHEIYVTTGATKEQTVEVTTPYVDENDSSNCYLPPMKFKLDPKGEVTKRIAFTLNQTECFEHSYTGIFRTKLIRVRSVEKYDIVVYAVNREQSSTDGWLALPDAVAAKEYYVLTYAPPMFASQFAIMNFKNSPTEIEIEYRNVRPERANDFTKFTLNAGATVQIQKEATLHSNNKKPSFVVDNDLTGVKIMASQEVHVLSGNQRALVCEDELKGDGKSECDYTGSRDHLVEQQIPLINWGMEYIITPIVDRKIGDQIKVLAANDNTRVRVICEGKQIKQNFTKLVNDGESFVFYAFSFTPCIIRSDAKILVAQITKSQLGRDLDANDPRQEFMHDPSMIFVPPVKQYTNKYRITTPKYSGGSRGKPRAYNVSMVLLAARAEDALAIHVDTADEKTGIERLSTRLVGRSGSRQVSDESTTLESNGWQKVPESDYWSKAMEIPHGMNKIEHSDQTVKFMCIYYGADERESIGFNVNMLLTDLEDRA